jgi:hypothetical protein
MTAQQFRKLALRLPGTEESSHMGHPDFRVGGRIFATLSHPNEEYGVVLISPAEQEEFMRKNPAAFTPAQGAWGRLGQTRVRLAAIDESMLREALSAAWRKRAPKIQSKSRSAASK